MPKPCAEKKMATSMEVTVEEPNDEKLQEHMVRATCEGRQKINYIVWYQTRCALIRNEPLLVIYSMHS